MFPDDDDLPPFLASDLISGLIPPPPPIPSSQFLALCEEFETYGVGVIVRAARFPLFALADLGERFFPEDLSYAGCRPGDPLQRLLSGVTLTYAGPSYERITERIIIEQKDADQQEPWLFGNSRGERLNLVFEPGSDHIIWDPSPRIPKEPELSSIADLSNDVDEFDTVWFLARFLGPDMPDLHSLVEGMMRQTPAVDVRIEHRSGEVSSWAIRRFKAPLPVTYAQAQIDNTQIKLGATGAAGNDIENLLSHLTRLTPDSALADKLNEGWTEYRPKRSL